jgi:hypothetical protein
MESRTGQTGSTTDLDRLGVLARATSRINHPAIAPLHNPRAAVRAGPTTSTVPSHHWSFRPGQRTMPRSGPDLSQEIDADRSG